MSYGPSLMEASRLIGIYSGKILRGANVAELPRYIILSLPKLLAGLVDHERGDRDRRREKQRNRNNFQVCPKIGSGN